MKYTIWQILKSKHFLYSLLTGVFIQIFAIVSARLWQWLIPWRWLQIIVWVVVYGYVFYKTILIVTKWINKRYPDFL